MNNHQHPTFGNGKICYIEIPSVNIEQSASFYNNVFGWMARKRDDGSIGFDDGVGEVSGSWVEGRKILSEISVLISIMVDDAEKTVALILTNGGKIIQPIGLEAPAITAHFADPSGNIMGIYQHKKR